MTREQINELIDLLMKGKIDELGINYGQSIAYDTEDKAFYIVNFDGEEDEYILNYKKISFEVACNLCYRWLEVEVRVG